MKKNIKNKYLPIVLLLIPMTNLKAGTSQSISRSYDQTFATRNQLDKSINKFEVIDAPEYPDTDDLIKEFEVIQAPEYIDTDNLIKEFEVIQKPLSDVDNLVNEFEDMTKSRFFNSLTSSQQFSASSDVTHLQKDTLHEATKEDLKARFGECYVSIDDTKPININKNGIRSAHRFVPYNYDSSKKPIVVAVVHGTFVPEADEFYSLNSSSPFYAYSCEFAKQLANDNQAAVEIISLQWSGKNCSIDRKNASQMLSQILNTFYKDHDIYTIAHSHGCNVVNNASRLLPENIFIKHAIHLACPVRDLSEEMFMPKQFEKLTQFYSNGDTIAALGSLTQYNFYSRYGNCRKFENQGMKITNIRVLSDGRNVGHSSAKNDIIKNLSTILDEINSNYILNRDLIMDINKDDKEKESILIAVKNPINDIRKVINKDDIDDLEVSTINDILKIEQEYSNIQTDKFQEKYNKEMNFKTSFAARPINFTKHLAEESGIKETVIDPAIKATQSIFTRIKNIMFWKN